MPVKEGSLPVMIVGGGVAGITMAFRLFQHNIPFVLFDAPQNHSSSRVASGLANPVVVKHFGLAWKAEEQIPEAHLFYPWMERLTGTSFYHPMKIFRIFTSAEDQTGWNQRAHTPMGKEFMEPAVSAAHAPPHLDAPWGGGWIHQAARIDVDAFLDAGLQFLRLNKMLREEQVYIEAMRVSEQNIEYRGETFQKVIFCQGPGNNTNPFFSSLPINPLKGQLIKVRLDALPEDHAVSKSVFVLPQGDHTYKVGATWEHTLEPGNTPEAATFLMNNLRTVFTNADHPTEILEQYYGFRPTVPDRKPLLGKHPRHHNLFIFNGLGSRGYMMAPWLSERLFEFAFRGTPLPPETDLMRYISE